MKTTKSTLMYFGLFCLVLLVATTLRAQKLVSPTFLGGPTNGGTLMQMNPDGTGFSTFYNFTEANGSSPMGSVMQASNGKYYATCVNGGRDSSCVIYCYDPTTQTYTNLWSFDIANGDFPMSGLVQAPNGLLWGAASSGGAQGAGVIYNWDINTNTYTPVYALDTLDGVAPCGKPVLAGDGSLYGMTSGYDFYYNAGLGAGTIYKFDISTGTYTTQYRFAGINDGYGYGDLVEHNGILYGMTSGMRQYALALMQDIFNFSFAYNPPLNTGNIFSYNPATNVYTHLYTFDSVGGSNPYGSLYMANDGKFYGVTSAGGAYNMGVIFSFDIATNTYTRLYDFNGPDGAVPMNDLTQSTDGFLYGATTAGGNYNLGVIYRFDPVTRNYTVLNNFDNVTNGSAPLGGAFALLNDHPTGILTPEANKALQVYPVPAQHDITISLDNTGNDAPLFTLTDVNGRIVWGPQTLAVNNNAEAKLNIDFLENGIYLLQATSGQQVSTKKIVRQ